MKFKEATKKSLRTILKSFPIMMGILLLISLIGVFLKNGYTSVFTGNEFFDPIIGALLGSISFGIPVTSYVVGGELLLKGVSLLAVTAFVMTWTTVGFAMLPLEAKFFTWRFALVRNVTNFFFAIIIAVLTVLTVNFL